jgi:glycosyltransferase involved in cell wall biosynthesis
MPAVRILHVCTVDATATLLLGAQLEALRRAGYDVEIACANGPFVAELEADGFTVHTIGFQKQLVSMSHLRALVDLYRVIRRGRYDVVHVHNVITAVLGRVAARLACTPIVIYTLHGFYFHDRMHPVLRALNILLERSCGRLCDLILSQSEEDVRTAIALRIVPAARIRWLGNGVMPERFDESAAGRSAVRRSLGIPDDALVVGAVGRIVREKGYRELWEAACTVLRQIPHAMFLVVGDTLDSDKGKFGVELRALIDNGQLRSRFVFTGFRRDPERLYQAMDVFVLPSHREGMPRSVIEAMTSGLAVVATDIRGCREEVVHGETGLLVPVNAPDALAAALLRLLSDPERTRAMGCAGRRRARELFDERAVCDRLLAAYTGLVARHLRGARPDLVRSS